MALAKENDTVEKYIEIQTHVAQCSLALKLRRTSLPCHCQFWHVPSQRFGPKAEEVLKKQQHGVANAQPRLWPMSS